MLELLARGAGRRPFGHAAVRRRPGHPAGNRPACMPFGGCRGALGHPVEARPSGRIALGRSGHLLLEQLVVSSEANEKLILALPKGRILKRGGAAVRARRHRARGRLRRSRRAPASLHHQPRRSRHHPRALLRRRDLRGLRRRPSRHRRRRRADGVRLSRDLRADRSRHRQVPPGRRRARRDGGQRRSAALEPCAHRHQVSRGDAPPLRRARRAGRVREAVGRHGAGAVARPQPPHRRPGRFGPHAQGKRPGRDRAHRRHHLALHRQSRRAQDASRSGSATGSTASARSARAAA